MGKEDRSLEAVSPEDVPTYGELWEQTSVDKVQSYKAAGGRLTLGVLVAALVGLDFYLKGFNPIGQLVLLLGGFSLDQILGHRYQSGDQGGGMVRSLVLFTVSLAIFGSCLLGIGGLALGYRLLFGCIGIGGVLFSVFERRIGLSEIEGSGKKLLGGMHGTEPPE